VQVEGIGAERIKKTLAVCISVHNSIKKNIKNNFNFNCNFQKNELINSFNFSTFFFEKAL